MKLATVHFHASGPLIALVGNPNCGKTALFNLLTDSKQKVANYAGVTVERKEGRLHSAQGKQLRVLDLPGTYSLHPRSPDERVTHDVLFGNAIGEKRPDFVVCVVDATNLRRGLRLVIAVQRLGIPCLVALNMTDMALQRGIVVDEAALAQELGVPVVRTVGIEAGGDAQLRRALEARFTNVTEQEVPVVDAAKLDEDAFTSHSHTELDHERVRQILHKLNLDGLVPHINSDRLDKIVLHPLIGPLLLAFILF